MSTHTMPGLAFYPPARDARTRTVSADASKRDVAEVPKSSILRGVAALGGILAVALATVLVPAAGPPSEEASALIQAQEVQRLAHSWVAAHPEDAVPTGDPTAWGFPAPEGNAACGAPSC
jgi:hypothetical protein